MLPQALALFRLIMKRGEKSSPALQTRRLSEASVVNKTDPFVLSLKRKTKKDRKETMAILKEYFDALEAYRAEHSIAMTLDDFSEHVKYYVKGRQTYRAAQVKHQHAQEHGQNVEELNDTVQSLSYAQGWIAFVTQRHADQIEARQARRRVRSEVAAILGR